MSETVFRTLPTPTRSVPPAPRPLVTWVSIWASLLLFAAGCAVGPEYVQPDVPVAPEWTKLDTPRMTNAPMEHPEWWTLFQDPVLDTLVRTAHEENLTLRVAGLRVLEARARLGIAMGNRFPQTQQLSGGYTRVDASENTPNSLAADLDYDLYNLGFDAAWELDFWGKFRRAVQSETAALEASVAEYDDFLVTLTAEVARTYVILRTFEERLVFARRNAGIQQRNLEISRVRFNTGAVTELDVREAESVLATTQALVPTFESGVRQARNALAVLLGKLPGELDEILGQPSAIPTAPAGVAVAVPAELLRRRPDIRRAERELAAQSARIGVAKADLYPHFSLFGSVALVSSSSKNTKAGGASGSDFGDLFDADSIDFVGGPSFRWDLFHYGRIRNAIRVQDARFQELAELYENAVLEAQREAEDAITEYLKTIEEVELLQQAVSASTRALELSQLQYKEGIVDFIRVLDASRALTAQQDLLADSRGSIATSLIAVYKALGGGWEVRAGRGFVPDELKQEMEKRTNWGGLLAADRGESPGTE